MQVFCKDLSLFKTYRVCFLSVKMISSKARMFVSEASKPPAGARISVTQNSKML